MDVELSTTLYYYTVLAFYICIKIGPLMKHIIYFILLSKVENRP